MPHGLWGSFQIQMMSLESSLTLSLMSVGSARQGGYRDSSGVPGPLQPAEMSDVIFRTKLVVGHTLYSCLVEETEA